MFKPFVIITLFKIILHISFQSKESILRQHKQSLFSKYILKKQSLFSCKQCTTKPILISKFSLLWCCINFNILNSLVYIFYKYLFVNHFIQTVIYFFHKQTEFIVYRIIFLLLFNQFHPSSELYIQSLHYYLISYLIIVIYISRVYKSQESGLLSYLILYFIISEQILCV